MEAVDTWELSQCPACHEGIGNVAPADLDCERRGTILKRREEQQRVSLEERFRYNRSRSKKTTMGALKPKS